MPPCNAQGFIAYSEKDLLPHGFIFPKLAREFPPGVITQGQLDNPPKGVRYTIQEDGNIIETRTQLPASGIQMEIIFRKLLTSSAESLGQVFEGEALSLGFLGGGAGAGIGNAILNTTIIGGLTAGFSDFTLQLLDAETKINLPVRLPLDPTEFQKFITTGIVELPKFPLSVMAVTASPIDFSEEQISQIGRPENGELVGIGGITDDAGRKDLTRTEIQLPPGTNNMFSEIIHDERRFRFRADNDQASSRVDTPFSSFTKLDATSKQIRITAGGTLFQPGDILYVTANMATVRRARHCIRHRGDVAQTSGRAGSLNTDVFGVQAFIFAWNFQLVEWRVPIDVEQKKVSKESMENKINSDVHEFIEGWRLSENITDRTEEMWAADTTGIVRVTIEPPGSETIFPRININDQSWFDNFLAENNLEGVFIQDVISQSDASGVLYDINEKTNSLLFDNEKIPYHRPFAKALNDVSAFVPGSSLSGIGIPLLDLRENGVVEDTEITHFDLSFAKFKETPMSSILPSAYDSFTCSGSDPAETLNGGAFFAPKDPNNRFTVFIPLPSGELESDWRVRTPTFFGDFTKKSRIYIEHYIAEQIDPFTLEHSTIYAITAPRPGGTIAAASSSRRDFTYVVYQDTDIFDSLVYQRIDDVFIHDIIKRVEIDSSRTHERPDFDHDAFLFIGYDRLLGDNVSYSNGRQMTSEIARVCDEPDLETQLFKEIILASELDISATPFTISKLTDGNAFPNNVAFKEIIIDYTVKSQTGSQPDLEEKDLMASLHFTGSNGVIDTVRVPVSAFKNRTITIDTKFYRGGPLVLSGEVFKRIHINEMVGIVANIDEIDPFALLSNQPTITFDNQDTLIVIYGDEISQNISLAASFDGGGDWFNFRDIIRLTAGESATFPYVIGDQFSSTVKLFYVLNESYLMYREVDITALRCPDALLAYDPPGIFDASSDDDLGLTQYSDAGKFIRKEKSYFVAGNANTVFFQTEKAIGIDRLANDQSARFVVEDEASLDAPFEDTRYSAYLDRTGRYRIFFSSGGKLTIKATNNRRSWFYDVQDIIFHKNFLDDPDDAELGISNIQVLYDEQNDIFFTIYFHDGMMFARRFQSGLLEFAGIDLEQSKEKLANYLEVNSTLESRPLFLVGRLTVQIRNAIETDDPNLAIQFKYPKSFAEKFNDDLSVDDTITPNGYITKSGLIRIYYADSNGIVNGLTVNLDLENPNISEQRTLEEKSAPDNYINPQLDVHIKIKS